MSEDSQTAVHRPWFAARVRSNHEQLASQHLRNRGYEDYVPTFKAERQWSDRVKVVDQIVFPGYVFCRLNPNDRLNVLTIPGLMALVSIGKTPAPIPDAEIEAVRRMVSCGVLVKPWPFLEVGQRVLVERGPLAGLEGILEREKGNLLLVISICLLQRSVSTEVQRSSIRPLSSGPFHARPHREIGNRQLVI